MEEDPGGSIRESSKKPRSIPESNDERLSSTGITDDRNLHSEPSSRDVERNRSNPDLSTIQSNFLETQLGTGTHNIFTAGRGRAHTE